MKTPAAVWLCVLCSCATARSRGGVEAEEPLSVMAYNVLFKGADDAKSLAAVREVSPDVLCLTEVTDTFIEKFGATFRADYPHRKFAPKTGVLGVGVVSRWPFRSSQVYRVGPNRRPVMEVTVQRGSEQLTVICVHLTPPNVKVPKRGLAFEVRSWNDEVRSVEGKHLVQRVGDSKRATIVVGDFNENVDGPAIRALVSVGFSPACDPLACSATFPGPAAPWPALFTIDHILGRGVTFSDARTVRAGGSDHFPVFARLRWGQNPRP